MDKISPRRRSANMSAIRSKGMKPELEVRRLAHNLGYHYRLHRHNLPGKPDLAFVGRRKVIFVHGCFWHQHPGCREGRLPGSNQGYWRPKLARNVERDQANITQLQAAGWDVLVIWECDLKDVGEVKRKLAEFLGPPRQSG